MNDELEEVKRKIDIVELISSYVTLKKAGANYKGLCPFHNEKTPSMMVSAEKQIFKCFGCNEGGDVFSFLMKIEGLGFGDALKTLAERAGVKLKPRHFEVLKPGEQPGQKSRLLDLNELAARLYHKILTDHPAAKKARDYLDKRGLSQETIREFSLGYAPASWDLLIRFAESRNYTEQDLLTAGLSVRKNQVSSSARRATPGGGGAGNQRISYDRFRERIVFPINNVLGNTVAFTGRLMEDKPDSPKYLNSSESPVYHKSSIIYGLDKAKIAIRQADLVVIVEGNMDVISCHQAGFKNVVAVSGTALTGEMLLILSRYTSNLAFSFDQDSAGQLAMKRAIGLAGELDLNSKIVVLPPEFKDPDEAIKSDHKNWEEAVKKSKPALEHLINILTAKSSDINAKKSVMKEILPVIKILKNQTEQEHYLKILGTRLLVSEQSLKEDLKRAKTNDVRKTEAKREPSPEEISDSARLIAILAAHPEVVSADILKAVKTIEPSGKSAELISEIQELKEADGEKLARIFASHPSDKLKEIWLLTQNNLDDEEAATISSYANDLAGKIRKTTHEEKKSALVAKIATADQQTDKKRRLELLKELNSVIINQDK